MLKFARLLSQGDLKPHQQTTWSKIDIIVKNSKTGDVIFECLDAEFPTSWSYDACKIVASKYFRQSRVSNQTETSVRRMVERVVQALVTSGIDQGYFDKENGQIFGDELSLALYGQYGSFNSPVWFNLGVPGVDRPQCSACFINSVEDSMDSILALAKTEGLIFKDGSGSGVNLSSLRGSKERIRGGGHASGPVSFMSGFDAFANVILSGGRTRRAARMVILDADHPDIYRFLKAKADEEDIVKILALEGMSTDFSDPKGAYGVVKHQSGNNTIRVSDTFMALVRDILHGYTPDASWNTYNRVDGSVAETLSVRKLFRDIAEAAHKCGDPGLQFADTINNYNTCANDGEIVASNPCSEFVWLNDSACNLASLNLCRFSEGQHQFNSKLFKHIVRLFITAQDIIVDAASYPTQTITDNSHRYRTLGLGYANLGGLLMSWGLGYDSLEGRDIAAALTSCLTAYAYGTSAEIAAELSPFERYEDNKSVMEEVLGRQQLATKKLRKDLAGLHSKANTAWRDVMSSAFKKGSGLRNAQVTLLAPTGTIAFMMDCATTGVEPDIGLKKTKTLVGGDVMEYVNPNVETALSVLGYDPEDQEELLEYMREHGHFEGSNLKEEHLHVFDCSIPVGRRLLSTDAHVNMCAAVQPFLSGAISKTFNMPNDATVEDVERTFLKAWERGVKCITIYREGSKLSEPLRVREVRAEKSSTGAAAPTRFRLPDEREQKGHKFLIGPHKGYITVGFYPDGKVGELFLRMAGHGSTVNGLLDSFGTLVSLALQYGIPLEELVSRFEGARFAPSGWTQNPEIPSANSIIGYVFKWIRHKFLIGTSSTDERPSMLPAPLDEDFDLASEPCPHCGSQLRKVGATCYDCPNCSYNTGACS